MVALTYFKKPHPKGFSFIELVVSMAILSILAAVALPYAEVGYIRSKEMRLQQSLKTIRLAIDRFREDCENGELESGQEGISKNCLPSTLETLVQGVRDSSAEGALRYYLRRIPEDPFAEEGEGIIDQWEVRGYSDEPSGSWYGEDVYDVRVKHERVALDGTVYKEW